jgi:nitroreductase
MRKDEKNAAIIDGAITSRRSVRKFLNRPVPRKLIEDILEISSRSPSGTNMQPWQVHIIAGQTMANLSREILDAHFASDNDHRSDYEYYPSVFAEPYKSRRKKVGIDLYGLLGIEKGAVKKMKIQHGRNFRFFDAPVGFMFTISRELKIGSWLDYGMFLQNIMIAARARGLDTCPQAAFARYHKIIRNNLNIEDDEVVICGMSLGYADKDAVENQLETERAPLSDFAVFHDV